MIGPALALGMAKERTRRKLLAGAATVQQENRELRETVGAQAEELELLMRRVAELEEDEKLPGRVDAVTAARGCLTVGVHPGGVTVARRWDGYVGTAAR